MRFSILSSSHWLKSTFRFPLHHLVFFYISALSHYVHPCRTAKERRKDTAGGRSDAILTSDWKPSHSLFPIKRPCQAREYEQDGLRDEERVTEEWETNWNEHREQTVRVWVAKGWREEIKGKRERTRKGKNNMPAIQQQEVSAIAGWMLTVC